MAPTSLLPPLRSEEQCEDVCNLVIKVNYSDTLRRFNAYVHQQFMIIEYDMNTLRAKIKSLFQFNPDAVLVLTYTDEDGDVVALDNDDELCDAVISQRLNPLRITVQLKSYSTDGSYPGPSAVKNPDSNSDIGSDKAIPAFDGFPQLAAELSSTVKKSLKSVPEPIRGALANIFDYVIKTASPMPMFSKLLLLLSKMQHTNVSQSSHEPTRNPVGMSCGTPSPVNSNTDDEPKVSIDPHNQLPAVLPQTNFVSPSPGSIQRMNDVGDCKQCLGFITSAPVIFDQNMSKEQKEGRYVPHDGKPMIAAKFPSMSSAIRDGNNDLKSYDKLNPNIDPMILQGNSSTNMLFCDATAQRPSDSSFSFKQQGCCLTSDVDDLENRPFASLTAFPSCSSMLHPYKRSSSFLGNMPLPFHTDIICGGCGTYPIVGPRYKSTVYENYNLCSTCFLDMGIETDHMIFDWSAYHFPEGMKDRHTLYNSQLPSALGSHNRMKAPKPKLDSCFIGDVTVWEGTVMSPCSRFTKIWRMRNNGTISWPFGTQLVRVRGDYFGGLDSAELKIPETGFPVDEELDIAIDCLSPLVAGQYVSYWQMVSPFGQKFGEEVWIIIQVDDRQAASAFLSSSWPHKISQQNNKLIIDVEAEPFDTNNISVAPDMLDSTRWDGTSVLQSSNDSPASAFMASIPVWRSVASEMLSSTQKDCTSVLPSSLQISNPLIDIPCLPNPPSDALAEEDLIEQSLLRELEEMGFNQIDLNKEILRQNQYDLELSLGDLCGFLH